MLALGGSSWARRNKTRSEGTGTLVRKGQVMFWRLFEAFHSIVFHTTELKLRCFKLPRYCDYWKDRKSIGLLEATEHEINDVVMN